MKNLAEKYKHIPGWGIDADPENDPTYPMKSATGDDHKRLNYQRPALQPENVEVLHSNERPNVTAAFGTSTPPSGLSGILRRQAFDFSEDRFPHWLYLLLADRVNVMEGILHDLSRGHVPNFFAERGWKAEWTHNRPGAIRKVLLLTGITAGLTAMLLYRKKRRKH